MHVHQQLKNGIHSEPRILLNGSAFKYLVYVSSYRRNISLAIEISFVCKLQYHHPCLHSSDGRSSTCMDYASRSLVPYCLRQLMLLAILPQAVDDLFELFDSSFSPLAGKALSTWLLRNY